MEDIILILPIALQDIPMDLVLVIAVVDFLSTTVRDMGIQDAITMAAANITVLVSSIDITDANFAIIDDIVDDNPKMIHGKNHCRSLTRLL